MTHTADLCDSFADTIQVAEPIFMSFGQKQAFEGVICTLKAFEDNTSVRTLLEKDGKGKVLVIDGGGSLRCAMVGGNLAVLAVKNGWEGIVLNGCIRDTLEIAPLALGIKALNVIPPKSVKRVEGEYEVPLRFAGADFLPGHYLYSDPDGIVVAERKLK